jgi:hypothetical protein
VENIVEKSSLRGQHRLFIEHFSELHQRRASRMGWSDQRSVTYSKRIVFTTVALRHAVVRKLAVPDVATPSSDG